MKKKSFALICLVLILITTGNITDNSFAQSPLTPDEFSDIELIPPPLAPRIKAVSTNSSDRLDVAVFYTQAAEDQAGGKEWFYFYINQGFSRTNTAMPVEYPINIVAIVKIEGYTEDPLDPPTFEQFTNHDGSFSEVGNIKAASGADFAMLVSRYGYACGGAWLWTDISEDFSPYAYCHILLSCSWHAISHEPGHLFGLAHEVGGGSEGIDPRAHAWESDGGEIRTIMHSRGAWGDPFTYSKPPTGVAGESENYNVLRDLTLPIAATWEPIQVPHLITVTTPAVTPGIAKITGCLLVPWSFVDVSVDSGTTWSSAITTDTLWSANIEVPIVDYVDLWIRINNGQVVTYSLPVMIPTALISGTATGDGTTLPGAQICSSIGNCAITDANSNYTMTTTTGEQTFTLRLIMEVSPTLGIKYYAEQVGIINGDTTIDFINIPGEYVTLYKVHLPVMLKGD